MSGPMSSYRSDGTSGSIPIGSSDAVGGTDTEGGGDGGEGGSYVWFQVRANSTLTVEVEFAPLVLKSHAIELAMTIKGLLARELPAALR